MNQNKTPQLQLGCGLIRIGRVWGVPEKSVPTEHDAQIFLESAYKSGIRFFDTAPAYGMSEERLGRFLKNLTKKQRNKVTVATKFGEHWDTIKQAPYVNHSFSALTRSLEQSMQRLGSIEILQLHKASTSLLHSAAVDKAFQEARQQGVRWLGASVSDINTGLDACKDSRFTYIQLPYNQKRIELEKVINQAIENNKSVLFNRPFSMGSIASNYTDKMDKEKKLTQAYTFIFQTKGTGYILTGTGSAEHLKENSLYFNKARNHYYD